MSLSFASRYVSHIGLTRDGNEDAALVSKSVIAVADGMGGHAGGEVASALAINATNELIKVIASPELDDESREDLYLNLLYDIDGDIVQGVEFNDQLSGMGTTFTSLYLQGENALLLHVGDSRCYSWNAKKKLLTQLSVDHTVMQELIDQGRLTPAEAMDHPQRSLLTQALVGDSGIDPMIRVIKVKAGDQFLLCSDGLTATLADNEIAQIISASDEDGVVDALLNATLENGAPDNVSIIWATVVEGENDSPTLKLGSAHE